MNQICKLQLIFANISVLFKRFTKNIACGSMRGFIKKALCLACLLYTSLVSNVLNLRLKMKTAIKCTICKKTYIFTFYLPKQKFMLF